MKITTQTKQLFVFLSLVMALEVTFVFSNRNPESQENIPIQPVVATTTVKIVAKPVFTAKQINKYKSEKEEMVKTELALHFLPDEQKVALAIIKQESSTNPRAKNYNCFYDHFGALNGSELPIKSRSCQKGDENYAWSIDCGLIQRNYRGTLTCPKETEDISWNVREMKTLYDARGWQPWVAFTSGAYLKFL